MSGEPTNSTFAQDSCRITPFLAAGKIICWLALVALITAVVACIPSKEEPQITSLSQQNIPQLATLEAKGSLSATFTPIGVETINEPSSTPEDDSFLGEDIPAETTAFPTTVVIRIIPGDYAQIDHIPTVSMVDYGSFIWLELTQDDFEEVKQAGINYEMITNPFFICLSQYCFSPPDQPQLPGELVANVDNAISGFYLLQLIGPTKDEWLLTLQALEVTPVQFVSQNSYIIWVIAPSQLSDISNLPFVRWVGIYHPAYRFSKSLLEEIGQIRINALVYSERLDSTSQAIEDLGGAIENTSPSGNYLNSIVFTCDAEDLISVARLPAVMSFGIITEPIEEGG